MTTLKNFFALIIILELILVGQIYASNASNDNNEIIPLRLKVGMITEAEFPEKIANVTKSVSSEILQIETLGNRMFLLPRDNFDSQIYVVTQDNVSYCLHLIMDETEPPTRIKIKKPLSREDEPQNKKVLNTIELMKALINGDPFLGAVNSKLASQEIFNDGKFRITADEVYELKGGVKAFVLTFENLRDKPVVLPIEHIELPGLLAISVDSQILEARPPDTNKNNLVGYTTKAYMIIEGVSQ